MITMHWLYVFAGAIFASFGLSSARDASNPKRWGNAAFWLLVAVSFWFGDLLGDVGNGILVLALVALAGFSPARAQYRRNRPALRSARAFPSATATSCSCPR